MKVLSIAKEKARCWSEAFDARDDCTLRSKSTCIAGRFKDRGDRKFVYVLTSRASEIHVSHGLLANLRRPSRGRAIIHLWLSRCSSSHRDTSWESIWSSPYRETAGWMDGSRADAREFPSIDSNFTNICVPRRTPCTAALVPMIFPISIYTAACVSGDKKKKKNWKLSRR